MKIVFQLLNIAFRQKDKLEYKRGNRYCQEIIGKKKKLTDIGFDTAFNGYLEISFWTVNSGHWMIEEVANSVPINFRTNIL